MSIYDYALGTSFPPTNIETLLTLPGFPNGLVPRGRFYEASILSDRLDGHRSGHGWPYAIWVFDVLTQDMVNILRTICPGYSANVYLRTRNNTGAFADYSGIMLWPTQDQMDRREFNGRYLGLEFQFRRLELYTGGGQLDFSDLTQSGHIALF